LFSFKKKDVIMLGKNRGEFMKRIALVFCAVFSCTAVGSAQRWYGPARTVTNADLEKFQQERIAAARDYESTYVERGQPSPSEIDQRNEQRIRDLDELSTKLRGEYLERDLKRAEIESRLIESVINAQAYAAAARTPSNDSGGVIYSGSWDGYGGYGYGGYGYGRGYRGYRGGFYRGTMNGGYVSGGWLWPTSVERGYTGFPGRIIGPGGNRGWGHWGRSGSRR
jgi:hypothetical protein